MAGRTLLDLFEDRVAESADRPALRFWRQEAWQVWTWSVWQRESKRIAAGLTALSVRHGDRVALLASCRVEWVAADMGILLAGAVTVPIHASALPRQCAAILRQSGATVLLVEDPLQLRRLMPLREELSQVRHVILLDTLWRQDGAGVDEGADPAAVVRWEDLAREPAVRAWARTLAEVQELGAELLATREHAWRRERNRVAADDVCSIMFTAGTSGRPRGVTLTHRNLVSSVDACQLAVPVGPGDVQLLFLPLSFAFARMTYLTAVHAGCETAFARGLRTLDADLQAVRPTFFVAVPRIFERMVARFRAGLLERARGPLRSSIEQALQAAEAWSRLQQQGGTIPLGQRMAHGVWDGLVYRHYRARFGGRLRLAFSGGAPLPEHLAHFHAGCGIALVEGYGLTETCGAVTLNRQGEVRIGTVGPPVEGVDVQIAEDGEILLRGPQVMQGYWEDPEQTAQVLQDGWLHTGDVGEWDGPHLRITDRKKDMILLATGRSIPPTPLESRLQAIPWVDTAVVYGEGRPWLAALFTLQPDALGDWARQQGLEAAGLAELRRDPRVYELIRQAVDEVNRERGTAEAIRRFVVLDDDFRMEQGELTASGKARRRFITEKYRALLDGLYDQGWGPERHNGGGH
jgi:long-chain acyl-CoA synthetase